MDKCVNLYYNQDKDYFVCANEDEMDMLDKRFIKLSVQPLNSLKYRMKKFLSQNMNGEKKRLRREIEEDKDEDKQATKKPKQEEKKDIEFKYDEEVPTCDITENDYIVSFGFEYEDPRLKLFREEGDVWKNYLLPDDRYKIYITGKKNELLEISADSGKKLLNKEDFGEPSVYKFTKLNEEFEIVEENMKRNNEPFEFDYLECIYTVKKILDSNGDDKSINLKFLLKFDNYIRDLIKEFYKYNYEIDKNYSLLLQAEGEFYDLKEYPGYENSLLKIYKPKNNLNLPWMMCLNKTGKDKYQDKKKNIKRQVCPELSDLEIDNWSTHATVGVKYDNIISFMEDLFKYNIYKIEKQALDKAIQIYKNISLENQELKNWLILKLFYLNMDKLQYGEIRNIIMNYKIDEYKIDEYKINKYKGEIKKANKILTEEKEALEIILNEEERKKALKIELNDDEENEALKKKLDQKEINEALKMQLNKEEEKEAIKYYITYPPLDKEDVEPYLNKNIDKLYEDWIKKEDKDEYIETYTDIRTLFNKEYKINKDTITFQIRHSLYQVLYELCGKDINECCNFLNEIITQFNEKITELDIEKEKKEKEKEKQLYSYFIQDFNKGIYYFTKLKDKEGQKMNEIDFENFQNYNDPDLSIEWNYGKIEHHTKYRIKYYNFSKDDKATLIKDTLLFEIRNYGSLKKAIKQSSFTKPLTSPSKS